MIAWPPGDHGRQELARRVLAPRWRDDCSVSASSCKTAGEALEVAEARGLLPSGWHEGAARRWFVRSKAGVGERLTPQSEVKTYELAPLQSAETALKATIVGAVLGAALGALSNVAAKRPVSGESALRGAMAGAMGASAPFQSKSEPALSREPESADVVQTLVALGDAFGRAEELAWEFSMRADEATAARRPEIAWQVRDVGRHSRWLGLDRNLSEDDPLSVSLRRVREAVRADQYERAVAYATFEPLPGTSTGEYTALGRAAWALEQDFIYRRLREFVDAERPAPEAATAVESVPYRAEQRPAAVFPPNVFDPLVELWRLGVAIGSWTPDLVTLVCPPWTGGVGR